MSAKKNRSQIKPSDKAPHRNTDRAKDPSSESDEQQGRFEGFDQDRTGHDATFQRDYDVDENDFDQRQDEYRNYNERNSANDAEKP